VQPGPMIKKVACAAGEAFTDVRENWPLTDGVSARSREQVGNGPQAASVGSFDTAASGFSRNAGPPKGWGQM